MCASRLTRTGPPLVAKAHEIYSPSLVPTLARRGVAPSRRAHEIHSPCGVPLPLASPGIDTPAALAQTKVS